VSIRDRRWCQGNLQHSRVLVAKGLHPASRQHFLTGIFGYLTSPLWLFQLFVSPLWLRAFNFGPLEGLWRALTYWRVPAMRRTPLSA
jgi:membrane glycosyltransferase